MYFKIILFLSIFFELAFSNTRLDTYLKQCSSKNNPKNYEKCIEIVITGINLGKIDIASTSIVDKNIEKYFQKDCSAMYPLLKDLYSPVEAKRRIADCKLKKTDNPKDIDKILKQMNFKDAKYESGVIKGYARTITLDKIINKYIDNPTEYKKNLLYSPYFKEHKKYLLDTLIKKYFPKYFNDITKHSTLQSELQESVKIGSYDIMQILVNMKVKIDKSKALYIAIANNHLKILNYFVKLGANTKNNKLIEAALISNNPEMLKAVIDFGNRIETNTININKLKKCIQLILSFNKKKKQKLIKEIFKEANRDRKNIIVDLLIQKKYIFLPPANIYNTEQLSKIKQHLYKIKRLHGYYFFKQLQYSYKYDYADKIGKHDTYVTVYLGNQKLFTIKGESYCNFNYLEKSKEKRCHYQASSNCENCMIKVYGIEHYECSINKYFKNVLKNINSKLHFFFSGNEYYKSDWNFIGDTYEINSYSKKEKQGFITIKDCYKNTCGVFVNGSYTRAISYDFNGDNVIIYYGGSISDYSKGLHELYVPGYGKKDDINLLDDALYYTVKCYETGHY